MRPLTVFDYGQLVIALGLRLRVMSVDSGSLTVDCPVDGRQRWPINNFFALVMLHSGADPTFH